MALSVNWDTHVITVPQADLTLVSAGIYEHDVAAFQRALRDLEDDETGVAHPVTHRHNTAITLAGVTYIRSVELINGFTVTYEPGTYRVNLVGANNNIIDVLNYNSVQVVANNSAGLQLVTSGSGVTEQDKLDIAAAVGARAVESGYSADQLTRLMVALLNSATGLLASGGAYELRSLDGAKTRVAGTMNPGTGIKTVDSLDLSP